METQDTETHNRVTRVALSTRDADGKIIATARVELHGAGAMIAQRRVAITGLGLVTPVGNDVATTWDAVLHGKSGGAPITLFDASGFPVHIAAEVKNFDDSNLVGDRKLLKFTNRSHRFALAAAEQALRDAGIRPTDGDATRWGCAVGAGMMGVDFDDLVATHAARRRRRRTARGLAADRRTGERSAGVLPQQLRGRIVAAHAPVRHPAVTRRPCIRPARPAARRWARR